jgi:hypothetical protein
VVARRALGTREPRGRARAVGLPHRTLATLVGPGARRSPRR